MVSTKDLKDDNKQWHEDHALWIKETKLWQHDIERLLALLYLLERALPEHSLSLTRHTVLIDEHEQLVSRYECGMDERCIPTCPAFKSLEEQTEFHQKLSKLHVDAKRQHLDIKQRYAEEMEKFRVLAKQLFDEC